jgi:hypothetical protein
MLMTPLCNRLSLRQATRRVTLLCDQALAPLDLRATQLSMLREIDRLGPGAGSSGAQNLWRRVRQHRFYNARRRHSTIGQVGVLTGHYAR